MVAAWMQDIGPAALGSTLVLTATSSDGQTWTRGVPKGTSVCAGGAMGSVLDPSVSIGPDGRIYLAVLSSLGLAYTQEFVTTSTDGKTWSAPIPMVDNTEDDFGGVVADPFIPGRAFMTWTNYTADYPPVTSGTSGDLLLSVTRDGGRTYTLPSTAHHAPRGFADGFTRLTALSDGSLLDVFGEISLANEVRGTGTMTLYSTRSGNAGKAWSTPLRLGSFVFGDVADPARSKSIEAHCCAFSLTSGPGRAARLVWTDPSSTSHGDVWTAASNDSGATWSAPSDLHRPGPAFEASVAEAADGSLAITWYEISPNAQPTGQLPTTLELARSCDGGRSWSIHPLAGPFDVRTAVGPIGNGPLGDYQSLVPVGGGFEAVFTLGRPQAHYGSTDIFAAAVPAGQTGCGMVKLQ
jgi:hypothetical protein